MNLNRLISRMERTAETIRHLVEGVSEDQASWRPTPDDWSALDVLAHLAYEEVHDFRDRLEMVLHRPAAPWPEADPARGVTQDATSRPLGEILDTFLAARRDSLDWLAGLDAPDWDAEHQAPFGPIRAGDVMAAWAAHDLLHLRQLTELHWAYLAREVDPYELRYAGPWEGRNNCGARGGADQCAESDGSAEPGRATWRR